MTSIAAQVLAAVESGEMTNQEIALEFGLHPDHVSRLKRTGGGAAMNGGSPANASHGKWRLPFGAEVDDRIRELLARGRTPEQAARITGVATGYVEQLRRESDEEPRMPRERAPLPEAESPLALSRVPCMVAGAEIGARDCVERQATQRCYCPKAPFAINALTPHALPGTRLQEQLDQCRSVGRSVILKPNVEDRHLGPALRVLRGEPVGASLIAGELPAAPARSPDRPRVAPVPPPPPPEIEPESEQPTAAARATPDAAEVSAAVFAARGEPLSIQEAEPAHTAPAEEENVPKRSPLDQETDDAVREAFGRFGGNVKAVANHFKCSWPTAKKRCDALRLGGAETAESPPRTPTAEREARTSETAAQTESMSDEFETMRAVIDGYRRLSMAGRQYVMGRINEDLAGRAKP